MINFFRSNIGRGTGRGPEELRPQRALPRTTADQTSAASGLRSANDILANYMVDSGHCSTLIFAQLKSLNLITDNVCYRLVYVVQSIESQFTIKNEVMFLKQICYYYLYWYHMMRLRKWSHLSILQLSILVLWKTRLWKREFSLFYHSLARNDHIKWRLPFIKK